MAKFKKGDFIKLNSTPNSFFIYEGIETELYQNSMYKRYSVIVFYDPEKYVKVEDKWETVPNLVVAKPSQPLDRRIESDEEGSVYSKLSEEEKREALKILDKWGYKWNEETLTISKKDDTESVQIYIPKITYEGEEVRPISEDNKKLLHKVCNEKSIKKPETTYSSYERTYSHYQYRDTWKGEYGYWD